MTLEIDRLSDEDREYNATILAATEIMQTHMCELMKKTIRDGAHPMDVVTTFARIGAEALDELQDRISSPNMAANLAIVGALYAFKVKPDLERENA